MSIHQIHDSLMKKDVSFLSSIWTGDSYLWLRSLDGSKNTWASLVNTNIRPTQSHMLLRSFEIMCHITFFSRLIIPIVPKLWHMQKKLISTQPSRAASHYPRRVNLIILFNKFLKTLNVFIWSFSFTILHFITFCEDNCHWNLKKNEPIGFKMYNKIIKNVK